ncbi:tetratricopeptide repeat protein, partial [Acinetobacter guillouiae]|uniref:tetratricopeptide repeat protein n=1 Tax=Acinetobacter guillouiae TaxID=106649 RepID=UPI003AF73762
MNLKEAKEIFEQAIEANRNDNIDKAIELFSQIGKTSNEMKEIYAKAQLNLGNLLSDLKRFSEAEQAYKNVLRADRVESYASAQFNLG